MRASHALLLLICASLSLSAHAADTPIIRKAPAFKSTDLLTLPREGWLTNGGTLYNQRYSPLDADQPRQRRER